MISLHASTAGCDKATHQRRNDSMLHIGYHRFMTNSDPILARIQAFDEANGGGVTVYRKRAAYHLYLTATQAPIARLEPEGSGDNMRLRYWSHQNRWKDVDDMGGLVLPLDQALNHIAENEIFWIWT